MARAADLVGALTLVLALVRGARAQAVLESYSPLFSPASGGVVLSIRGSNIPLVNNITCSWEEPASGDVVTAKTRLPEDFDDTLTVAAEIQCTAPRWPYRASTVDFFLEENGAVLKSGWNFTFLGAIRCRGRSPLPLTAKALPARPYPGSRVDGRHSLLWAGGGPPAGQGQRLWL